MNAGISQVHMCLCTFNQKSRHFSGVFSLSFHLLSYLYFGTFLSFPFRLVILIFNDAMAKVIQDGKFCILFYTENVTKGN